MKELGNLLSVCNQFGMNELKDEIATQLDRNLSLKNWRRYLQLATQYRCDRLQVQHLALPSMILTIALCLQSLCITFMAAHFQTLLAAGKLLDLDVDIWCQMIDVSAVPAVRFW